jgi:hypothetical protein
MPGSHGCPDGRIRQRKLLYLGFRRIGAIATVFLIAVIGRKSYVGAHYGMLEKLSGLLLSLPGLRLGLTCNSPRKE